MRIDVTEYVRRILAAPSANHGLVLGAVTGDRRADIQLRDDAFDTGVAARLVVVE